MQYQMDKALLLLPALLSYYDWQHPHIPLHQYVHCMTI